MSDMVQQLFMIVQISSYSLYNAPQKIPQFRIKSNLWKWKEEF